jgi:tripeptide aminopeptidase
VRDGLSGAHGGGDDAPPVAAELVDLFVRLASIRSPSREEREVADAVTAFARAAGLAVEEDASAAASGCACGNLIVRVPGRGEGTPVALCAHLDTVPAAEAPTVVVENGVVRSDGRTVLGADDKAAVAALLLVARDLAREAPAADVEFVFTAGEEIGLRGAKAMGVGELRAQLVCVFDSEGEPGTVIVNAPTLKAVVARFRGTAAHAGIDPEHGRSAVVAASRAVAAMRLGRLDGESTANVGLIQGGSAVNVVPDLCVVQAEVRSRDEALLAAHVSRVVEACTVAAAETGVDVDLGIEEHFHGYAWAPDSLPLRLVGAAFTEAGVEARHIAGGGGSDSNAFNARGLAAVTLGVGFERVHSPQESIRVERLEQVYRVAHAIVRAAARTVA